MRRLGAWAALFPALAAVPWLLIDANNVRGRGRERRFDMSCAQFLSLLTSWDGKANSQAAEFFHLLRRFSIQFSLFYLILSHFNQFQLILIK